MHELGITLEIMDIATREMLSRKIEHLKAIGVRIGALSGIDPESLAFCFDASKIETPLAATEMQIEYVPVKGHCQSCGNIFQVDDLLFICPQCSSGKIKVREGEEMQVAYLIGADDE